MPSATLLSALGFPGWCALHLILDECSPELLLRRLRPLAEAQHVLPASRLLPLLLECLGYPSPWPPQRPLPPVWGVPSARFRRGRLVCRAGAAVPLRLQLWVPPVPGSLCWRELGLAAGSGSAGSANDLDGSPTCDPDQDRTGLGLRQSFGSGR
ncbi:hypothetical protein NZK33_07325 [Cyanobium sp. FGCU-6]|nr:hypothetical protein [Cyanobium sp. FGCU6]